MPLPACPLSPCLCCRLDYNARMPIWMPVEAAALLVSFFFAVRNIFIRAGQRYTTPLISTFAVTFITCLLFIPVTLLERPGPSITWIGVLFFILAGAAAPGLALLFYFARVNRIGVARASPIASTQPLVTLIIAVSFMGERPSIPIYFGTLLIVGGIVLLTSEKGELRWTAREIALPLVTSVLWSVSSVCRKIGMSYIPWPAFGSLVITITALFTLVPVSYLITRENRWRVSPAGVPYLLAAGICLAGGFYFHLFALGSGALTRVAPLANTSPLMTVLLTAIFLRKFERVSLRLIVSTVVIFIGGTLITMN